MAKNVTPIPATRNRFTESLLDSREKRKVAGYARVSTDSEEQASSYEAQMDYYRNYINSRSDWVFVDMYSDEGVTGTSTKSRDGFNKMVSDALDGKIDLIITKSVSRFARNTVDSLSTVRKLKENGIEIYFEKENIWTLDSKGELLITIMSSLAQEESRSISENTTWGTRKKMADGKFTVAYSRFLGYDKGPDGQLVINEEEAGIIRLIYRLFLEGYSYNSIATELTKRGILSPGGKKKWCHTTVMSILSNEKYKGDALLQKTYIEDFLTKKKKKNNGELTSYYINNDHEAIIEPRIFDLVQTEMKRRSKMPGKFRGKSVYMLKIKCGCCGGWYGIKIWHSNEKCRKTVYQCMQKYEGDVKCTTPHLMEKQIQSIFIKAVNIMIANRESVLEDASIIKERLCDVTLLERDLSRLKNEADIISKLIDKYERENASMAIGQEEYNRTRGELVERYKVAEAEVDAVKEKINDRRDKVIIMENFIEEMKKYTEFVTEFDAWMWSSLIDHFTVFSRDNIQVNFRDGTNIPITID